jgi:inorganic pyrophosphatase
MLEIGRLSAFDTSGAVRAVVESPRGSAIKLKYDPELGVMTYGRPLPLGLRFPCEWGFVPGTLAEDGDPLDVLVLSDAPTFPGIVIACRPIGVIEVEQDDRERRGRQRNDRIVAVPLADKRAESLRRYEDVAARVRAELEAFLLAAVQFQDKHVVILGRGGPEQAQALVRRLAVVVDG